MNQGEKMTWNNANNQCRTFGGKLVSIHSPDENLMIMSRTVSSNTASFWIGLRVRFFIEIHWQYFSKFLKR